MDTQRKQLSDFQMLFENFYPKMVEVAVFYLHDLPLAEDIVSDIFVKLWENKGDWSGWDNVNGYLRNAVKNSCLNHLKHQQVKEKFEQEYLYDLSTEESSPEEYLDLISKLVDQLPPQRKRILEMSVVASKSNQEIANALGLSINTVKDHLKKAYAFLKEKMKEEIPKQILFVVLFRKQVEGLALEH